MAEEKTKQASNKDSKEAKPKQADNKSSAQSSARGFYYYMNKNWKAHSQEQVADLRKKMVEWRNSNRITKIEKPTRLDKARRLGYKAKRGFVIFRVTIERGGRQKPRPTTKRRSKRFSVRKILRMNYKWVAEQRVQRKYRNLEVLNSYFIGKDGKYFFFEIICVDPNMPEIKSDSNLKFLQNPANRFRTLHGLTSSGIKSRGLMNRNPNLKVRPSLRAWHRKGR
jgi:large subunit ribosomal protein L15e